MGTPVFIIMRRVSRGAWSVEVEYILRALQAAGARVEPLLALGA